MDNTQLHVFGSKIFYNLIKELSTDYNINFFVNKITEQKEIFLKNDIKIIFPENLTLNEVKDFLNKNSPIIFLVNNKKEQFGDSGVFYIESDKDTYDKVIKFIKSSEMNYSLARFVKNDDLYIIDVNIDKLSFEELDETVSEIENLGVKSITFVTNEIGRAHV